MRKVFTIIYNRPYILVPFGIIYALVILLLINLFINRPLKTNADSQTGANGPTGLGKEDKKGLLYYITSSQELLNKARVLSANTQQTFEQKQEILTLVKLALNTIGQGINYYPGDDRGYAQRASIYEAIATFSPNSISSAIQDLQTATKINRQNPQYPLRLATIYSTQADFSNAAVRYYEAHLLNPTDTQIVYNLADCLERSGQYQQANRYFDNLITLLPPNDTNIEILKKRQVSLTAKLQDSKLQYLSNPGSPIPPPTNEAEKPTTPNPPFGVQEAPAEQAAIASNIIIAGDNEDKVKTQNAQTNINATKGTAILKAGEKEITIKNRNIADQNFVYIKPITYTRNHIVYISERKSNDYLKVSIDTPTDFDIEFEWWIIR